MPQEQIYDVWVLASVPVEAASPEDAMSQLSVPGVAANALRHFNSEIRVLTVGYVPMITYGNITSIRMEGPDLVIPNTGVPPTPVVREPLPPSFAENTNMDATLLPSIREVL